MGVENKQQMSKGEQKRLNGHENVRMGVKNSEGGRERMHGIKKEQQMSEGERERMIRGQRRSNQCKDI